MDEEQRRKLLLKRSLIVFSTFFKETRPQRVSFLLGPTNASNHVYMRSGLETEWRQLADRRGGRQPAREEVYWRTLMSNARQDKSGAVHRPPEEVRDGFHISREVLWKQEEVLPRVLRGKRPILREGVATLAGTLPMRGEELNSTPVPEHLEEFFQEIENKERDKELAEGLKVKMLRDMPASGALTSGNKERTISTAST